MKTYDDLQRFKEKTQTQGINFKDMSGQSLDSDQPRWAIIRQLTDDKNGDDVLAAGQRIDLAQPQPVKNGAFSAPAIAHLSVASAPAIKGNGYSLLESVAASLKPADAPAQAASLPVQMAAPAVGSLLQQMSAAPAAPNSSLTATPVVPNSVTAPAPVPPAAFIQPELPPRFGGLFRARSTGSMMLPKDTLLKPLLEKIALCR